LKGDLNIESITAEEIFGYDLGLLIGQLWLISNKNKSTNFKAEIQHGFCVDNTSFGKVCVKGDGGFIGRPRWFYKVKGSKRIKVYYIPFEGVSL
jgi:hypothetical protein